MNALSMLKIYLLLFRLTVKRLFRSPVQRISMGLFFILGCYSLYQGHAYRTQESQKLDRLADSIRQVQMDYQAGLSSDTLSESGKQAYDRAHYPSLVRFYYPFLTANVPHPLSVLDRGQRDLYPGYYILNAQNLYTQTLKGTIQNPFTLSAGAFDLAFVLVYLLPLWILVMGFDAWSVERDLGTLSLLETTGCSANKLIIGKLICYFLLALLVTGALSGIGFILCGRAVSLNYFLLWQGGVTVYILWWCCLLYWIISWRKGTSFTALLSISCWTMVLLLLPALVNLYVGQRYPTHYEDLSSLMRSRTLAEDDQAMQQALDDFYQVYPEYKPAGKEKNPFFYFQGYSAFLALEQIRSDKVMEAFYQRVRERNACLGAFNWMNPAVAVQDLLHRLAHTDLLSCLRFKEQIQAFHQRIFWFSNKPLFENRWMRQSDYDRQPHFEPAQDQLIPESFVRSFLPLGLTAGLFILGGYWKLKRQED